MNNRKERKLSVGKLDSLEAAKYVSRACARKKAYPNKKAAESRAQHSSKKIGEDIEAYKCHFNRSHYHIGHKMGSKKKGIINV